MRWTGLLVSVRDPAEAAEAIAGGAGIVDVKEPGAGALGAAPPWRVAAVARVVGARGWTCACGELVDAADDQPPVGRLARYLREVIEAAPAAPALVKAGMSETVGLDWRRLLAEAVRAMPDGVGFVGVAYADHRRARAPDPESLVDAAAAAGCAGVLVDTFDKGGPGLFGHATPATVAAWVGRAHAARLPIAVAGRLPLDALGSAARTGADVVAVRSAVCAPAGDPDLPMGDRDGAVQRSRVAIAVSRLAEAAGRGAR